MASRFLSETIVEEQDCGQLRRWRVLEVDEPKGRAPTAEEMASAPEVMLRPPPAAWMLKSDWTPSRRTGPREQ